MMGLGKNYLAYENRNHRFRLQFPEEWAVVENPYAIVALLTSEGCIAERRGTSTAPCPTKSPCNSIFSFNLNVTYEDLVPQNMSLDMFMEHSLIRLRAVFGGFEWISQDNCELAGKPGRMLVYIAKSYGKPDMQFMQCFTINEYRAYVLTYGASRKCYLSRLDEARSIIESFLFCQ